MREFFGQSAERLWSIRWMAAIRLFLYFLIIAFVLQYIYFGQEGFLYRPWTLVALLTGVFLLNLVLLPLITDSPGGNLAILVAFLVDIAIITLVVLCSGGFSSIFLPYYLAVLIMASAWLPRRYTAVFPSVATLGLAVVGLAQLLQAGELPGIGYLPYGLIRTLHFAPAHLVVATMLLLTFLFFVVSYLSGYAGERLLLEQRLNAEVLAGMEGGVAVIGTKGDIIYINDAFLRIFPDTMRTADIESMLRTVFGDPQECAMFKRLLHEGRRDSFIVSRAADPAANRPPIEIRASSISARASGAPFGALLMVSDLTLRLRMEKAERNVERFSAISTMATGLAHEIRNPLASLRSAIQEIGDAFPEDSQNRMLTRIIMTESDRLDSVIGRFLDFSREERLTFTRTRLGGMLKDVAAQIRQSGKGTGLEVAVKVEDDPEVVCDPDRVKSVFLNIALNAASFVPASGGRLGITLRSSNDRIIPGVEVDFDDNGPGLEPAALEKLFEPFFTTRPEGTGLGLPISRKQVEMHGGEITAVNRPEGGARFSVWLPLDPGTEESARSQRRSRTVVFSAKKPTTVQKR